MADSEKVFDMRILPLLKSASVPHCRRIFCFPERNGPIMESAFSRISCIVPSAMTLPPSAPAFGPISISQSASFSICVS